MAYNYCNNNQMDIKDHIFRFFESPEGHKMVQVAEENGDSISFLRVSSFLDNMRYMGQEPSEWDGDYTVNLGYYSSEKIEEAIGYKERREQYVMIYTEYLKRNI